MDHTPFIVAAYAFALLGSVGLALQSFAAMRAKEQRADAVRGRENP